MRSEALGLRCQESQPPILAPPANRRNKIAVPLKPEVTQLIILLNQMFVIVDSCWSILRPPYIILTIATVFPSSNTR